MSDKKEDKGIPVLETFGISWLRSRQEDVEDFDSFVIERLKLWEESSDEDDGDLKEAVKTFSTYLGDDDLNVIKAGWQKAVKRYGKTMSIAGIVGYELWGEESGKEYAGISREKAIEINNWLWDKAFRQRTFALDKLVSEMSKEFELDERQAENIIRTEMANIFNKMREWGYEGTRVRKFRWVAKEDACEKCKEVERLAEKGVTLEELKRIIKQVGGKYAREWTVHPQCRCTFIRKYGEGKGWERIK